MINNSFGAAFIGILFTAILYGITTLQTFYYYNHYPKDRRGTKTCVAAVWALDTLHLVFVAKAMYHYLIDNYDNPSVLDDGHWALFASLAANISIAFLSHWYFTVQIFRLCRENLRWLALISIGILNFVHLGFGIESVVLLIQKRKFSMLGSLSKIAFIPFAALAIASDVVIAGALCILLQENKRGMRKTRTLINTLIAYAINRCLLTSLVAVAELIVYLAIPHSLWFLAIDFVIGELWANSLLASLNSRHSLLRSRTEIVSPEISGINFRQSLEAGNTDARGIVLGLELAEPSSGTSAFPSEPAQSGIKDLQQDTSRGATR